MVPGGDTINLPAHGQNLQKAQITASRGFVQKYVDGAGEGIRTPASTKPTSYLAFRS
jgi:hypothetical protein